MGTHVCSIYLSFRSCDSCRRLPEPKHHSFFEAWCLFFLAFFGFYWWARSWPSASTPNLEGQVIFGQGFLPLALDNSILNCRAAVLVLVHPGILFPRYPPYLVSVPLSATWGGARWETSNFSRDVCSSDGNMTIRPSGYYLNPHSRYS